MSNKTKTEKFVFEIEIEGVEGRGGWVELFWTLKDFSDQDEKDFYNLGFRRKNDE